MKEGSEAVKDIVGILIIFLTFYTWFMLLHGLTSVS